MRHNPLKHIRKELGITQDELARRLGVGKSAISMIETGKASLSERNKYLLVQEFNVNPDWLRTGKGDIFTVPITSIPVASGGSEMVIPAQSIPLFTLTGEDRFSDLAARIKQNDSPEHIFIPNMPRCDGAITMAGDGMDPLLRSGDIALFKFVNDPENIIWGEIYIIALDIDDGEYLIVRFVKKSDKPGYIRLVSDNRRYTEQEIPTGMIRGLALVKASVRFHSIK